MTNGIVIDSYYPNPEIWVEPYKVLDIRALRIWGPSIDPKFADAKWFKRNVQPWKKLGYTTIACLTFRENTTAPTVSEAAKYFATVDKYMKGVVDYVECGNEWLFEKYAHFYNAADWAKRTVEYHRVARENLPGYKILACPMTYGANAKTVIDRTKALIDAGISDYVDIGGVHLYADSAAGVIERAKGVKALYGSKPVWCTEWSIDTTDAAKFAVEFPKAVEGIKPYIDLQCGYRAHPGSEPSKREATFPFKADGSRSKAFEVWQAAYNSPIKPEEPQPQAGTVKYKISGVIYSNDKPAVGASVILVDSKGDTIKTKTADKFGYYEFVNTPDGKYSVNGQVVTVAGKSVKLDIGKGK